MLYRGSAGWTCDGDLAESGVEILMTPEYRVRHRSFMFAISGAV